MGKPKVKRPIQFKLDALQYYSRGESPKRSFELAADDHNTTLSGCMIHYASSYMSDDIKNFLIKKVNKGDREVISWFKQHPEVANFINLQIEDE